MKPEEIGPPILYKYRRFEPLSLRMITHSEIWFSCVKSFNDPFEFAPTYNFEGLHTEIAEDNFRSAIGRDRDSSNLTPEKKGEFQIRRLTEIRGDPSFLEKMNIENTENNYRNFGICSLSSSRDNPLLWAHYTAAHTGFCVGLSVPKLRELMWRSAKEQLIEALEVKYQESLEIPKPNYFDSMKPSEDTFLDTFISTKSKHWSYEEEWRIVLWGGIDKSIEIGYEAISEVILGCKMNEVEKECLLFLCGKYIPDAKIFKAVKDDKLFKLNIEPLR